MGLLRWIVAGFGWEVGKTAAKEAIDATREKLAEEPEETVAQRARRLEQAQKQAEKRAAFERKARQKEAKQREKQVDRELAALKKRMK